MTHADRNAPRRPRRRACCRRRRAAGRFQLQRPEDRGLAARARADRSSAGRHDGRAAGARRGPDRRSRSPTSRRASSAWSCRGAARSHVRGGALARRAQRRHRGRRVGEQPAAGRRRERAARDGIPVFVPPLSLSTDNAAMIGAAALRAAAGAPATTGSMRRRRWRLTRTCYVRMLGARRATCYVLAHARDHSERRTIVRAARHMHSPLALSPARST